MSAGSSDVQGRLDEIYELVATDDLANAIKRMLDLARDFSSQDHQDEARLLSQRRHMFDAASRKEEITREEYFAHRIKLGRQALQLSRAIVERLTESTDV